jgi:Bacteriophage tail sheath protein
MESVSPKSDSINNCFLLLHCRGAFCFSRLTPFPIPYEHILPIIFSNGGLPMPATLSYPGVYIEEISSGVRTITGVATSITAFVGRTRRGPVNEPITINGFADFDRIFGGLWELSPLSFAVRDFYLNGGSQAVIVRLYAPLFANDAARATALAAATTEAQTAADLVKNEASNAAGLANATAASVATAANNKVATASAPGQAAALAAQQVAAAADSESKKAPYMTTAQRMDISGLTNATTGTIKLKFQNIETGTIDFAKLRDSTATTAEGAVQTALTTLVPIGATGISSVTRTSGAAGVFSFVITFGGSLAAAPQPLIDVSDNSPVGGTPTVTISFPLPDAASVKAAAATAAGPAVIAAANTAAPVNRALLSVDTLNLEAANPGVWGNALRARVDHDVTPGPGATDLFNLGVFDGGTLSGEIFRNVSGVPNHRRNLTRVLEQESKLVRTHGALPPARPTASPVVPSGGDPFSSTNSNGVTTPAADGNELTGADYTNSAANKTGIFALEKTDLFNILCLPPFSFAQDVTDTTWSAAASYCEQRRAMLVVDAPGSWVDKDAAKGNSPTTGIAALGTTSKNSAVFFPRLRQPNPLHDNQYETFAPCGAIAGVFARTDSQRGVWKAPAGLDATLVGVPQLSVSLTDAENGELNPLAINCLRAMPAAGRVVWGSRTLQGDDRLASEWKYIPVRRTALFLEESLYRGTKWVVFEPNDEPLWAQIRLNLGAFMHNLFRQGAFQGMTPKDAYFVKCDKETTTQADINLGIVNILVGFAPLKPAEFVVIKIQQMAGQIET